MSEKAQRTEIQIGPFTVEGFMLPDGSYRLSQTQAAEVVGLKVQNVSDFLRSKALKGLLGEGYTPQISEIEPGEDQVRGGSRIRALPLDVISAYWLWQAFRGNKQALALCWALVTESLERRFDDAFGVDSPEAEYNQRITDILQRNSELEWALRVIGEGLAMDDLLDQENRRLRRLLQEHGINPDQDLLRPGEEDE